MNKDLTLCEIREEIDRVDDKLLRLLAVRIRLAKAAGKVKEGRHQTLFCPDREKAILARLKDKFKDDVLFEDIEPIFASIFCVCLAVQNQEVFNKAP